MRRFTSGRTRPRLRREGKKTVEAGPGRGSEPPRPRRAGRDADGAGGPAAGSSAASGSRGYTGTVILRACPAEKWRETEPRSAPTWPREHVAHASSEARPAPSPRSIRTALLGSWWKNRGRERFRAVVAPRNEGPRATDGRLAPMSHGRENADGSGAVAPRVAERMQPLRRDGARTDARRRRAPLPWTRRRADVRGVRAMTASRTTQQGDDDGRT